MYNLWPRQAQFMTVLTFDLQVWAWPSKYLNNVSNHTSTCQGEQLCQFILKSMHKCPTYGQDKLNLWSFYHLTFKCDLDLQPTWTNVSNGTLTPKEQQQCQIILKSMHKCRSYGLDRLNLWLFYHLTFMCDFDLQPTWTNISNDTSTSQGQLCQIILKSMHTCTSYGPDKSGQMDNADTHITHAQHTHIHQTEVVTTTLYVLLTTGILDKNLVFYNRFKLNKKPLLQQNFEWLMGSF